MLYQDILIHTENSIYYLNGVQESEKNSGKLFIPVESLCIYIFFYCFKTWVFTLKMGTTEQTRFKKNISEFS